MEHYKELLHVRFAERVMGWTDVEPSREGGGLKFFGTIYTNRGPARREVPDYSNDLNAMWGAEQYLKSLGLTEAYLNVLKDVVGNDLKVHTGKEFVAANAGRKLPRPQGDLIGEIVQGTPGYLYYAVSTYSWYDPKTFRGGQEAPGVFHKSRTMR